ncbi:hypothetical protein ONZ45_g12877 [Pleurotus djamor]|nr:hypothetical protein ONZ45_g12877 [Pleurotus djamor]
MPKLNITLDNNSPLIEYQPQDSWGEGDGTGDPFGIRYSNNGTVRFTSSPGASASFTFHGTGIWIFGAKRSNHGPYNVTLDDTVTFADGFALNPELFQTVLYNATNLKNERHTVTIRNDPSSADTPFLDIDFITFESETSSSDSVLAVKVDESTSDFDFSPPDSWQPLEFQEETLNSARLTTDPDASLSFSFTGGYVSLFGVVGPNCGPYSVQIDNLPATNSTFNATSRAYAHNTLLFHAADLGAGNHTLRVTNSPQNPGQELIISHAIVGTNFATYTAAMVGSGPSAEVVLIVVSTLAGLLIVGVFVLLIIYFHRKQARQWK